MVPLLGAQFSKPLLAPSVTHLVWYKFEGEKYKRAERLGIKIVNHRWLEDCLKSWKILPEDDYSESGWGLEIMEAQSKERLKFPIRERIKFANGKYAMKKSKKRSSKVLAAALALLNHAHPEVGTDFLACHDLPPDIQGPNRQVRQGRKSLCCLVR